MKASTDSTKNVIQFSSPFLGYHVVINTPEELAAHAECSKQAAKTYEDSNKAGFLIREGNPCVYA